MNAPLILASASSARAAILRGAGVSFEQSPAPVDEDELKAALRAEGAVARDQADFLAEMKAMSVSRTQPGRLVLGADQILSFEGQPFDKPRDLAEVKLQLQTLRGERHDLLSAAVVVKDGEAIWRHIGVARLRMRPFTDHFLNEYLSMMGEEVKDTVGGYKLEGLGAQLFSRIDGDYFTILGLPLIELLGFLRMQGVLTE